MLERTEFCNDCYFSPKYAVARVARPMEWAVALRKCDDVNHDAWCHTSDERGVEELCHGMMAYRRAKGLLAT